MASRSYRVFVSSTYSDLSAHRAHVIRALRQAGFSVDPMEDWTADSHEPTEFCQDRIDGCDLCILLVALRRGHVPSGQGKSITQLEYRYARRHNIDVLAFMLGDEEPWPPRFVETHTDPEVAAWRAAVRKSHGVSQFGLQPSSVEIAPALSRWMASRSEGQKNATQSLPRAPKHPSRWMASMAILAALLVTLFAFGYLLDRKPTTAPQLDMQITAAPRKGEAGVNLLELLPARTGYNVQARWTVPVGYSFGLFWLDSEGKIHDLTSQAEVVSTHDNKRNLVWPDMEGAREIEGRTGTELIFVCARRGKPPELREIEILLKAAVPLPRIETAGIVRLSQDDVLWSEPSGMAESGLRAPGGHTRRPDGQALRSVMKLQELLGERFELFEGVAFPHVAGNGDSPKAP